MVGDNVVTGACGWPNSWPTRVKKFGRFSKRLYLCTPFTENRQNGLYERRVGQSVKTPPFHGGMRGSTPLRGTQALLHKKFKAISIRDGLFYDR